MKLSCRSTIKERANAICLLVQFLVVDILVACVINTVVLYSEYVATNLSRDECASRRTRGFQTKFEV